jgi:hypothetical protein
MSKHIQQGCTPTVGMWAVPGLPVAFVWSTNVSFHYPKYVLMDFCPLKGRAQHPKKTL